MAAPRILDASLPPHGTSGAGSNGWVVADQPIVAVEFSEFVETPLWVSVLPIAGGELTVGNVGGDGTLKERDLDLRTVGGQPLTVGLFGGLVRVANAAGEWSDGANFTFRTFNDVTTFAALRVERASSLTNWESIGFTNSSGTSSAPMTAPVIMLAGTSVSRSGGGYSTRFRFGGVGGTLSESPVTSTSTFWSAFVRLDLDGTVTVLGWAGRNGGSGFANFHSTNASGQCVVTMNDSMVLHNADGSLAHTVSGDGHVALLQPTGAWAWVRTFSGSASLLSGGLNTGAKAAIGPASCFVRLQVPAAATTISSPGWSWTKPNSNGAVLLLRLSVTDGGVVWSTPVTSSSTGTLPAAVAAGPADECYISIAGSNQTFTLGSMSVTTSTSVGGFIARLDTALGYEMWVTPAPSVSALQRDTRALAAGPAGVYVGQYISFGTGTVSTTWGGFTVQTRMNTCVGYLDRDTGTVQWFAGVTTPSTSEWGHYVNNSNVLLGASDAGVWAVQGVTNSANTRRYLAFRFIGIDGMLGPLAKVGSGTSSTPQAWGVVAPASSAVVRIDVSSRAFSLFNGDTTTYQASLPPRSSWMVSIDPTGTWGRVGGQTALEAISPPYSQDWPSTVAEDGVLSATFTGTDLRDPAPEAPEYELRVLDPATGTWVAPTLEEPLVIDDGVFGGSLSTGTGTLALTQMSALEPMAGATFVPDSDWNGRLRLFFAWFELSGGNTLLSAASRWVSDFTPVVDAPGAPEGSMPETAEDSSSTGTFTWTDPDRSGTYTLQLSPQTQAPEGWDEETQGDFRTTTGTTVTVVEDSVAVGTATVLSITGTTRSAQVRFTPIAHWHGSPSFALRVSNGGAWSPWVNTTVTVTPVPDAPSAVIGDAPSFDEDNSATFTLSWTDPDNLDGDFTADSGYELELGLTMSGPWTTTGTLAVPGATITVLEYSTTDLSASLRVDGDANYYGSYAFAARVHDTGDDLRGPARLLTSSINSVPDTPARVTPSRMPAARHNQTVEQTFSTFDPDPEDTDWTFTMSAAPTGPWTGTLTITGVGTLDVLEADLTDQQATVRLTQPEGGATLNRYSFYIRATDSSGRSSVPTKVIGYISDPLFQGFLQRLDRTQTAATIVRLVPLLGLTRATVTDALAGPGSLELTASAAELRRRAEELNLHPSALLEPGSVEVVISLGAEPLWVGPISEVRWDAGQELVDISARGLLSHFDARVLAAETTYTAEDLSAIVANLVADTQTLDYGSLGIEDGTVPAGVNGTLVFEAGSRISDALRDVGEIPGAPEVWVDPERTLRAATTRGSDRRSSVRITSGLVEVASWTSRDDDIVTAATVIAPDNGNGPSTGSYADTAAMAIYGRIERVYEAEHLLTNAACAALAEQIVRAHAARAEAIMVRMTLDPTRPVSARSLGVGDVVTVDLRDPQLGQVLGAYRIVNRVVELAQSSSDAVTVTLDLEPARWVNGVLVGSRTRHVPEVMVRLQEVDVRTR